jgi:malate synthase
VTRSDDTVRRLGGLTVAEALYRFVEDEALPGSSVSSDAFWAGLEALVDEFSAPIRALLVTRDDLQRRVDDYHRAYPGVPAAQAYERFLHEIGYLADEPDVVEASTSGVDTEISEQAGPQLVVPLMNERFAANAANARWGSLYDALYGTDAIDESGDPARGRGYNAIRGAEVVARSRVFLDRHFPVKESSHAAATAYSVDAEGLAVTEGRVIHRLEDPAQFLGFSGDRDAPSSVLLVHHGLRVDILIDRSDAVGAADAAGVKDVVLESAVTTIMDLEDSVAAVDVDDKVVGYRSWLRLMRGVLAPVVTKNGREFVREMNRDRAYTALDGTTFSVPGRSLLFVRHVGHHMMTDAVRDKDGRSVPEGIVDAIVTAVCSAHDLRGHTERRNSRTGSMYVVKPKMHGPEEVALSVELMSRVEDVLGFARNTIKLGIMDEERRTTLNLKACIAAAGERIAFINTGFLDRTGDEIHTSMHAGPVLRKNDMRGASWIDAYERSNVATGLACGLRGRSQIGKGMWAAPDNMAQMLATKGQQLLAGASCAWVPSPTAATLHATHYHDIDVAARQRELAGTRRPRRSDLLTLPLGDPDQWSAQDVRDELDNNVQGILGYVARWVDAGIGCSKIPDLVGTGLMEDRATCRISSQHVANWLLHGVIRSEDVDDALERMAAVVDDQNAHEPWFVPLSPEGNAYQAARALIFEGVERASGYTEPALHRFRLAQKAGETVSLR